ncbi:MAG: hypothetical protein ACI81W_000749 [Saprospiraceae bacterium]|jgi:hypothetical protein
MRIIISLAFTVLLFSTTLLGQKKLQSPEEFLPTDYGKHFTPHHLLVDYFEYIAENSAQVILREYGKTNEKRPLIWAVISSPENLKNLEIIRTDNLKRTGLMEGKPSDYKPVAIVWLSYGVHGNEAGGSESSLATVYELTRPDNKKVQTFLEDAVVIMDPSINPDGYSRYTHWNWNAANLTPTANPESREHHEPWPGGRVNHYLFDLNRDWAWQTQIETQQRLEIYHQWMPHIHVDYHEQGTNSPYYFAPAAQPYHQYITDWQGGFQHDIGKNHAGYFDKNGWLYFTKEVFDLFYPSYGDTYPIFNGAIGMTHEQAGNGAAGRAISIENGDTLTIRDRIDHHLTTSISNVEIAAKNAKKLRDNFEKYFKESINNPQGKYKTFIIAGTNNEAKLQSLCKFLDKHRIKYGKAGKVKKGATVYSYISNGNTDYEIKENDLLISAHQAKGVLAQVLFEPDPFLIDSLTYDITAWSAPHAFGLEAYASTERINPDGAYIFDTFKASKNYGEPYAYLAPWNTLADARFLGNILSRDIKVRAAVKNFTLSGVTYPAGTLVITRADNRKNKDFDKIVRAIADQNEKTLVAATTGLAEAGHDLGSSNMQLLTMPKIALLHGDRVSGNAFGHTWHYLEQDLGYPITVLAETKLSNAKLDNYNVIIMQEGRYSLNNSETEKLKSWVSSGGRLIAVGRAISSLAEKEGFNIKRKSSEKEMSKLEKDARKMNHRLDSFGDQERNSISDQMPGAIFKLKMDNTHPLAFGLPDYYFSLKTSAADYAYLEEGWNVGYIPKELTVLGFAGANVKKKMKETVVFGVQEMGSGKVIYLVDNPMYRGFWKQGKFLFSNAIFMTQ